MSKTPPVKSKHRNALPTAVSASARLPITNPDLLLRLCGDGDENLRLIERELDIKVSHGHQGITISGQDSEVSLAQDLLTQLVGIAERGETLTASDIQRSLSLLSGNKNLRLADLYYDQVQINGRTKSIVPKTPVQKEYLEAIRRQDMVFGIGPAGTGKTYLAMTMAVSALMSKEVKRIVLARPAVEAGEKLGFLPGDMAEKVNPYLRPLYDALHDMIDVEKANELVEKGIIEVAPLAFMRGRTLSDSFCILDEAQNTTPGQMKMFLTRLGQGSKCVVTGDPTQVDLPRGQQSGLIEALQVLKTVNGISFVQFSEADVIRHALVGRIVAAYNRRGSEG